MVSFLAFRRIAKVTAPLSVNFNALLKKFVNIWFNRNSSATITPGSPLSSFTTKSTPFLAALSSKRPRTYPINDSSVTGAFSSSIFPASIFEKSKISLITPSNMRDEAFIFSRYSSCLGVKEVSFISSLKPIIALIGVRISWLILAKN